MICVILSDMFMHGGDSLCGSHHRAEKYRFHLELPSLNAGLRGFTGVHRGSLSLMLHLVSPCFDRRQDVMGRLWWGMLAAMWYWGLLCPWELPEGCWPLNQSFIADKQPPNWFFSEPESAKIKCESLRHEDARIYLKPWIYLKALCVSKDFKIWLHLI